MQCMKCGREIPVGQVFCRECLDDMERYPVKPGTPVLLPSRKTEPIFKKVPRRKMLTPTEEVHILKRRLCIITATLSLLLVITAVCLATAVHHIRNQNDKPLPGQNYSAAETRETE